MDTLKLSVMALVGVGILTVATTTITNVHVMAITTHESGTFLECSGVVGVGAHESYACDRIALYLALAIVQVKVSIR
jgi:hypothetical protein